MLRSIFLLVWSLSLTFHTCFLVGRPRLVDRHDETSNAKLHFFVMGIVETMECLEDLFGEQPMMRALNRLTYDASSELVGIILGVSVGLISALYDRLFRES